MELPTARAYQEPRVVQFSIFMDNRVGRLRELLGLFDGTEVQMAALSIIDAVDYAIIRCVLVPSQEARGLMRSARMPFNETELVVVEMPSPDSLGDICESLIKAEVNIHYAYPLLVKPHGNSALALHVDEPPMAVTVLLRSGFALLGEADLK